MDNPQDPVAGAQAPKPEAKTPEQKLQDARRDCVVGILQGLEENASDEKRDALHDNAAKYLQAVAAYHIVSNQYNILIIFDETRMTRTDADSVYGAITSFKNEKPLLLVVYSDGGDAATAYLIAKLCQEYCNGKFIAVVPRAAKSAATLLCCGAHEIHMGSLSELGPIDPQINGLPALGLKNAVEQLAALVATHPQSAEMFAKYLNESLPLMNLGYYERVAESAVQYAERILNWHKEQLAKTPAEIAKILVHGYKDHSFVIDAGEAATIFGNSTIKTKTNEYALGNALYDALKDIQQYCKILDHKVYWIGSLSRKVGLIPIKK